LNIDEILAGGKCWKKWEEVREKISKLFHFESELQEFKDMMYRCIDKVSLHKIYNYYFQIKNTIHGKISKLIG
jgi:hypothetical protein